MSTKSKIPAVVRAYLRRAPKIKGYRVLSPLVRARPGDGFIYLHAWDASTMSQPTDLSEVDYDGHIQLGRTLLEARQAGVRSHLRQYTWATFDGVIYRPTR